MKFGVKNLGPIKEANVEIGDLTIICGKNNCGKTYLTYSLYSFLKALPPNYTFPVPGKSFDICYKEGFCTIDSKDMFASFSEHLEKVTRDFTKKIHVFLAMTQNVSADNTQVFVKFDENELNNFIEKPRKARFQVAETCTIVVEKEKQSSTIKVHIENTGEALPPKENLRKLFRIVCSIFFNRIFPDTFSLTGERSGISIFAGSIADFSRKVASQSGTPIRLASDWMKITPDSPNIDFPLPVLKEIEFFQNLNNIRKRESFIKRDHPEILQFADKIFGGKCDFDDKLGVQYFPKGSDVHLALPECSSSVKSLVEFSFYLRHCAKREQILMIDEPELNLHPENQRYLARLLAMLINAGIKVFITTHSDYIVRELNILLMLNNKKASMLKSVSTEFGYGEMLNRCLLSPDKVRCYVAADGELRPMDVDKKFGIEVTSFDDSINGYNSLQNKVLFGE